MTRPSVRATLAVARLQYPPSAGVDALIVPPSPTAFLVTLRRGRRPRRPSISRRTPCPPQERSSPSARRRHALFPQKAVIARSAATWQSVIFMRCPQPPHRVVRPCPPVCAAAQYFSLLPLRKGLTLTFFWHTMNILKASQSLPPAGGKKMRSFFTATCAWGKIPLRLPV